MRKSLRSMLFIASVSLSPLLALLLFVRPAVVLCRLLALSAPVVTIHEYQRLFVLAFIDQAQNALAIPLHPCIDEIVPGGDGEAVQSTISRLLFQVDLVQHPRHFAVPSAFVHEKKSFLLLFPIFSCAITRKQAYMASGKGERVSDSQHLFTLYSHIFRVFSPMRLVRLFSLLYNARVNKDIHVVVL